MAPKISKEKRVHIFRVFFANASSISLIAWQQFIILKPMKTVKIEMVRRDHDFTVVVLFE
jgi:hypothetical protein